MAQTQRYWDGNQWTQHVAPVAPAVPPQPVAAAPDYGPQSVEHWLLPVGRSGAAIAAGYVGIAALVFAGLGWAGIVVGAVALGLGIWAFMLSRRGKHGAGRAIFAMIAGVIGIVVGAMTIHLY
jgi:hypothetical protein